MMDKMKLSERMQDFRADRPSEWLIDEWSRDAGKLEAEIAELKANNARLRDALDAIASCKSKFQGDVVDIAQKAVKETPAQSPAEIEAAAIEKELTKLESIMGREFGSKVESFISLYRNQAKDGL